LDFVQGVVFSEAEANGAAIGSGMDAVDYMASTSGSTGTSTATTARNTGQIELEQQHAAHVIGRQRNV
jgi:hypothetical protein